MNKFGIGIIGYGMIGRGNELTYRELGHYYPKDMPAVNLAGVCTSSNETAIRAAQDATIQFGINQLDRSSAGLAR
jgi:predicted dehydrogenase